MGKTALQRTVMADIHQLILADGVERAKELAENKPARQRIEAASRVMADEEHRIGITHAGFAMTSLPHRSVAESLFYRGMLDSTEKNDRGSRCGRRKIVSDTRKMGDVTRATSPMRNGGWFGPCSSAMRR